MLRELVRDPGRQGRKDWTSLHYQASGVEHSCPMTQAEKKSGRHERSQWWAIVKGVLTWASSPSALVSFSWWTTLYKEHESLWVTLPASTLQPYRTFCKVLNTTPSEWSMVHITHLHTHADSRNLSVDTHVPKQGWLCWILYNISVHMREEESESSGSSHLLDGKLSQ